MRRAIIATDHFYHIYNRSIAKYEIFNNDEDFDRFPKILKLYRYKNVNYSYSHFMRLSPGVQQAIMSDLENNSEILVEIICYCLMPTHFHLILKQVQENGISDFISKVANSYSKFFNITHGRKGPLWESRFSHVLIRTDEQLLHVTRYFHLNATSAGLVKKPEDWKFSSYKEYLHPDSAKKLCHFEDVLDIKPSEYKKFVNDRINYQKELSKIKKLLIDGYSG